MNPLQLEMRWTDVLLASWRADAALLARTLPPGVELDRFAGDAWLSVVPFRLQRLRPRLLPVPWIPGLADVGEINLRTYVRVRGEPGIWFYSLDASSALAVVGARAVTALPYFRARIDTREADGAIVYRSERRQARPAPGRFDATYRPYGPGRDAGAVPLDGFLHERYRFFVRRAGRLWSGRVRHAPWTVRDATIEIRENTLGALAGHPLAGPPQRCTFARGAVVRADPIARVRDGGADRGAEERRDG